MVLEATGSVLGPGAISDPRPTWTDLASKFQDALLDARRQALRGGRMVVMEGQAERPFAAQDFYAAQAHAAIGLRAS